MNDKAGKLYFIELKYFKKNHARLGTGSKNGMGFQIEILKSRYKYFERNLRWILATEEDDFFRFCTNKQIRENIGNGLGKKYNSISRKIFNAEKIKKLSEDELEISLIDWLNNEVQ